MAKQLENGSWVLDGPIDGHLHARSTEEGDPGKARLPYVLHYTLEQFDAAVMMPNLSPPVTTAEMIVAYRDIILKQAEQEGFPHFRPLMVLYITENTTPEMIHEARAVGTVAGKFYPQGGTTGAASGVRDFGELMYPVYEAMQNCGMLALFHGADPDPKTDLWERERMFVPVFNKIAERFPGLRMVFEHMSTRNAVACVRNLGSNVFGGITPLHLQMNRTDFCGSGLRPSIYAFPIVQAEPHRQALIAAATSGDPKFFAGTDSAPHFGEQKYCECGAMGSFTAPHAFELYAEVFEAALKENGEGLWLERLEAFTAHHMPDAYGIPRSANSIILERSAWQVPERIWCDKNYIVPLRPGEMMHFKAWLDKQGDYKPSGGHSIG